MASLPVGRPQQPPSLTHGFTRHVHGVLHFHQDPTLGHSGEVRWLFKQGNRELLSKGGVFQETPSPEESELLLKTVFGDITSYPLCQAQNSVSGPEAAYTPRAQEANHYPGQWLLFSYGFESWNNFIQILEGLSQEVLKGYLQHSIFLARLRQCLNLTPTLEAY